MLKNMTSNLDERQEQALLKIEHNCCWLAFWGLLSAAAYRRRVNELEAEPEDEE